jgi:hypothetical protein
MLKVNSDNVYLDIRKQGYSIVPGFLSAADVLDARKEYFASMDLHEPHSQGEKFKPIDLIEKPWRKFAIGSKTGNGEPYSQVLQTTYFSQDDKNYPSLSAIFNAMVSIRNAMTDMPLDYGNNIHKDDFWNACRVHHYPRGGGHMAAHRDTLFPRLLSDFEFPFMQMMVTLTNRETDFNNGGGYVYNNEGKKVFFETKENSGSLVFFDGNTVHGVEDIDSDELLDFKSKQGRIALFVNLYANPNK